MTRYPPLSRDDMYFEQRRVADLISKRRKPSASSVGGVEGPFVPLVYVPRILDTLQSLGEYCRFYTSLPPRLRELAIMITARKISAQIEFHVHAIEAREFGIDEFVIEAVANDRRPGKMDDDETLVHDFCTEMYSTGRVSEALLKRAEKRFGKATIVELVATCGYYKTLGLVLNVSKATVSYTIEPPFPTPED